MKYYVDIFIVEYHCLNGEGFILTNLFSHYLYLNMSTHILCLFVFVIY